MTEIKENIGVKRENQFDIIEVYDFTDMNPAGLFSNNMYGQGLVFNNLMTLVMLVEDCMNHNAYPQPMTRHRKLDASEDAHGEGNSFLETCDIKPPVLEMPSEWKEKKPLGTFRLRIVFRTMSGWQGDVECLDSGKTLRFRSDMELIMFMAEELRRRVDEISA
ncbi:MAG: hypothetical protein K5767_02365 [Clostridia bacterium]|nr:hypothetical protein [Clostridia bacterium]